MTPTVAAHKMQYMIAQPSLLWLGARKLSTASCRVRTNKNNPRAIVAGLVFIIVSPMVNCAYDLYNKNA